MRLVFIGFLTAVSLALADPEQIESQFRLLVPSDYTQRTDLIISGKHREYYVLDPGSSIELTLTGPARLRLLSRAVVPPRRDKIEYSYVLRNIEEGSSTTVKHKSVTSEKAQFAGEKEGALAESRNRIFDVPRGTHKYTITHVENASAKLFFRLYYSANEFTGATEVVAMTPASFTQGVDLVSKEETITYYRIGEGNHAELTLIGPATLKVLSRMEFDSSMTGVQKWKVRVIEDGQISATHTLSARKSDVTQYQNSSSRVPSTGETFYVEVPRGEHKYEFVLPDNHRTALLRFLLPKSQLDLN